jgi:hypothetical protein
VSDPAAVELPEAGDGARRNVRPGRWWPTVALLGLLVLALVGAGTWWWTARDEGEPVARAAATVPLIADPGVDLVVQRAADGAVAGLVVLVLQPRSAAVLQVPTGTLVPGADGRPRRIDAAPDLPALQGAVATLLRQPIREVVELAPGEVPELDAAAGAAPATASAAWRGWLGRAGRAGTGRLAADGQAMATVDVTLEVVPGDLVGEGDSYRVRQDDLDRLLASVLPGSRTGRPARVQVLNGTGRADLALAVPGLLADLDVAVTVTGSDQRVDQDVTRVVYYDASHADVAAKIRAALGVGELDRSQLSVAAIDVTVVLGRDFRSSGAGSTGSTTSTTTTTGVPPASP